MRDWFRRACEAAGLRRARRQRRHHVRHPPGHATAEALPIAHGLAPRHPADRRQVRRRPRRARRARSGAYTERCRHRDRGAADGRELDRRGGRALRPRHAGVGRPCRRLHRTTTRCDRTDRDGRQLRRGARRIGYRGAMPGRRDAASRRCSNCTSSRGRCWRPKTGHRRRHRRPGHALVRRDDPRPRRHTGTTPMHLRCDALSRRAIHRRGERGGAGVAAEGSRPWAASRTGPTAPTRYRERSI